MTDFALRADGGRGAGVGKAGFGFGRSEGEAPSGFGRIWAWFKEAIRSWMDNDRSSSSAIERGNNNGNGTIIEVNHRRRCYYRIISIYYFSL